MHFKDTTPFRVTHTKTAQPGKASHSNLNSSLLKTEQKHLQWWFGLIWRNINLDHLLKTTPATNSATSLLPGSMASIWDVRGCLSSSSYLIRPYPNVALVQHPLPDTFPSPAGELVWDYMPGKDRRIDLI